jgi:hypothetical protein
MAAQSSPPGGMHAQIDLDALPATNSNLQVDQMADQEVHENEILKNL